jgi:hypothetical protein
MSVATDKLVSELTVGELMELTQYVDSKRKLDEAVELYKQKMGEIESVARNSEALMGNYKVLEVSSPFELKTAEEVDRFTKQLLEFVGNGSTAIIAMGIR